jgi:hypothetical protein
VLNGLDESAFPEERSDVRDLAFGSFHFKKDPLRKISI